MPFYLVNLRLLAHIDLVLSVQGRQKVQEQ